MLQSVIYSMNPGSLLAAKNVRGFVSLQSGEMQLGRIAERLRIGYGFNHGGLWTRFTVVGDIIDGRYACGLGLFWLVFELICDDVDWSCLGWRSLNRFNLKRPASKLALTIVDKPNEKLTQSF